MSNFDFETVKGSAQIDLTCHLQDSKGSDVDITAAFNVKFTMWDATNAVVINAAAATVLDAPTGYVKYTFVAADLATAGTFTGRFKVTWNTTPQTIKWFPTEGITIEIEEA